MGKIARIVGWIIALPIIVALLIVTAPIWLGLGVVLLILMELALVGLMIGFVLLSVACLSMPAKPKGKARH